MDIFILTKYRRRFVFQIPLGKKNESYHDIKNCDDSQLYKDIKVLCILHIGINYLVFCLKLRLSS